jgi:FkbM family methyltransferase
MRKELFFNPRVLCERLAVESERRRRLAKLRGTPARELKLGHIDSLELLELCRQVGIRTIYDIGANVGTWSLLARSVLPESVVHAFEPLPACCDAFHANVAGTPGITLHQIALGSADGSATMYLGEVTDTSSLLRPGRRVQEAVAGTCEMPVRRLDSYVSEQRMPPPDLIKLDVQGYELKVLEGGPGALSFAKALICEVSFVELYEGQCLFGDVVAFLAARGFAVSAFGRETATGTPVVQADVLFLKDTSRHEYR